MFSGYDILVIAPEIRFGELDIRQKSEKSNAGDPSDLFTMIYDAYIAGGFVVY